MFALLLVLKTCIKVKYTLHLHGNLKLREMKTNYLFPVVFRKIGWSLLIPFGLLSIYCLCIFNDVDCSLPGLGQETFSGTSESFIKKVLMVGEGGALDEIATIGLAVSLILVSFSKEKDEDECIARLRMSSLVWAILVNYVLLILAAVFIYGVNYLNVAFVGMFTVLILFIVKYNWELSRFRKTVIEDE